MGETPPDHPGPRERLRCPERPPAPSVAPTFLSPQPLKPHQAGCWSLVCSAAAMGWEPERGKGVVSPGEGGDAAGGMCVYTVMLHLDDGSGAGWDDDDFLGDGALVCDSTTEAIEDLLDASPAAFGALPWEEQRRRLNLLIGKPRLWALTCDPRHGGWRIDSSVPLDVAPDPC